MSPFIAIVLGGFVLLQAQAPPPLRIVVLEGEGAVNVIQQKTAVRPLVEVRDRNNLPVGGATVTFTIGGGQPAAFAGGAQTLTVTTNAAGQAAAGGFNVVGTGSVQVQVQAVYQGQIATAAISQTNVATAAAAAQAGAGAGGSSGATTGTTAAAGGGGISGTTIAITGAAVAAAAGGAVAATQLGGESFVTYTGSIAAQYVSTITGTVSNIPPGTGADNVPRPSVCNRTNNATGTIRIELTEEGTSGKATLEAFHTETAVSANCNATGGTVPFPHGDVAVSGNPSALAFTSTQSSTSGTSTRTERYTFNGSLSGNTITGTLAFELQDQSTFTSAGGTTNFTGSGSFKTTVTLQR